jgi:hypothetical protein
MLHIDKVADLVDKEEDSNSDQLNRLLYSKYGDNIFNSVTLNKVGGGFRKKQKKN